MTEVFVLGAASLACFAGAELGVRLRRSAHRPPSAHRYRWLLSGGWALLVAALVALIRSWGTH